MTRNLNKAILLDDKGNFIREIWCESIDALSDGSTQINACASMGEYDNMYSTKVIAVVPKTVIVIFEQKEEFPAQENHIRYKGRRPWKALTGFISRLRKINIAQFRILTTSSEIIITAFVDKDKDETIRIPYKEKI